MDFLKSPIANQIFVVTGVYSTIISCGLGLGCSEVSLKDAVSQQATGLVDINLRYVELAGEIAFVLSVFLIPFISERRGRKNANFVASISLLLSWIIKILSVNSSTLIIVNILFNVGLGGTVAVSSIIISEYCSPKYRGPFLILEIAAISFGILISHLCNLFSGAALISAFGMLSAGISVVITSYWPESPYWLISKDQVMGCKNSFYHLRGSDEEALKELKVMLDSQKIKLQLEVLKPARRLGIGERIKSYMKSLLKTDFLRPLLIAILLFSFIGFGGENLVTNYSFRDIFNLNRKYVGTIILDVLSLICSLTTCVLIQIVRRKTLFIFTGSCSVIFLAFVCLILSLQSFNLLSQDYIWLYLTGVTGFSMFMSLGTTALPFSILGEIFPMSYKGIGSSITCAYFWAFGNSLLRLVPWLVASIGLDGVLILSLTFMIAILLIINKILPETNAKSLIEIEQLMTVEDGFGDVSEPEHNQFDRLKLLIDLKITE